MHSGWVVLEAPLACESSLSGAGTLSHQVIFMSAWCWCDSWMLACLPVSEMGMLEGTGRKGGMLSKFVGLAGLYGAMAA